VSLTEREAQPPPLASRGQGRQNVAVKVTCMTHPMQQLNLASASIDQLREASGALEAAPGDPLPHELLDQWLAHLVEYPSPNQMYPIFWALKARHTQAVEAAVSYFEREEDLGARCTILLWLSSATGLRPEHVMLLHAASAQGGPLLEAAMREFREAIGEADHEGLPRNNA
jgi:hypothetical protein